MEQWSRQQIIALIHEILDVENHTEEEIEKLVHKLESGVVDPNISDYIFWDDLTPEEIADKALSYRPICL